VNPGGAMNYAGEKAFRMMWGCMNLMDIDEMNDLEKNLCLNVELMMVLMEYATVMYVVTNDIRYKGYVHKWITKVFGGEIGGKEFMLSEMDIVMKKFSKCSLSTEDILMIRELKELFMVSN